MAALSYTPPPPPEIGRAASVLLGTEMPRKPPTAKVHGVPPRMQTSSSRYSTSRYPTCARPGEPVNQVFVQFSNDLEGFLPYTLVISEEHGLEFTSLSSSPDFMLDPLNVMRVELVSYDALMKDAFFVSLSRSVLVRPGRPCSGASTPPAAPEAVPELERVRPPYYSVVQMNVKRTVHEGGQIVVFIAVQSEPLAEELVRSCHQLKKRRVLRNVAQGSASATLSDEDQCHSAAPSRGCPTPRTLGSRTPPTGVTPPCSSVPSPAHTPIRTPRLQLQVGKPPEAQPPQALPEALPQRRSRPVPANRAAR